MSHVALIFLAIGCTLAGFAWATIWSRRDTVVRHIAMAALVIALPALAVAAAETLGWHKPIWAAWRLGGEQRVIGSKLVEGEGIYLYLDVGRGEPRAIVLPWNTDTAERLQKAEREAEPGAGAIMRYEWSWDSHEPQFHPAPPPVLPLPKGPEPDDPHRHERAA